MPISVHVLDLQNANVEAAIFAIVISCTSRQKTRCLRKFHLSLYSSIKVLFPSAFSFIPSSFLQKTSKALRALLDEDHERDLPLDTPYCWKSSPRE